jgi:hypothetical protein
MIGPFGTEKLCALLPLFLLAAQGRAKAPAIRWFMRCPCCGSRLRSSWSPPPIFVERDIFAQAFGGRGNIAVVDEVSYLSHDGNAFLRRWAQRLADVVARVREALGDPQRLVWSALSTPLGRITFSADGHEIGFPATMRRSL